MINSILIGGIGAFSNAYRGGFIEKADFGRRYIFLGLYGVTMGWYGLHEGTVHPWTIFLVTLVMAGSLFTGWGVPIGAAGGWNREPLDEWRPLDTVASLITVILEGEDEANPRTWGTVWLTLHGFFFGSMTALLLGSAWPCLWMLMGMIYWTCARAATQITKKTTDGWPAAEWAYGYLQWFTVAMAISS